MRPLRRIVIDGLTIVSLLLFVSICVLWVRSYRGGDLFGRALPFDPAADYWRQHVIVQFSRGRVFVGRTTTRTLADASDVGLFWQNGIEFFPTSASPFSRATEDPESNFRIGGVVFTAWSAAAIVLILSAWLVRTALRRRQSAKEGYCKSRGYDLCATPHHRPECGAVLSRI